MTDRPNDKVGHEDSGEVVVTAANGNTPQTVFQPPSEKLFAASQIIVEYDESATAAIQAEIFDDADGTAAADVGDRRKTIKNLQPGEVRSYDGLKMRDFDEDVLVQTDGNQDGELAVYVDGDVLESVR